jgi:hypothetical protein
MGRWQDQLCDKAPIKSGRWKTDDDAIVDVKIWPDHVNVSADQYFFGKKTCREFGELLLAIAEQLES